MTLAKFQSALASLVENGGASPDPDALTELESRRLASIATDRGAKVMRTLYFSWRLTKVLSLLPLTGALLGDEALARHLRAFWRQHKARSLYFVEECLSFLSFLEEQVPSEGVSPHFPEVVAFERARLELRQDQSKGQTPRPRRVHFRCPPGELFQALRTGAPLSNLSSGDFVLVGKLGEGGQEQWSPRWGAAREDA